MFERDKDEDEEDKNKEDKYEEDEDSKGGEGDEEGDEEDEDGEGDKEDALFGPGGSGASVNSNTKASDSPRYSSFPSFSPFAGFRGFSKTRTDYILPSSAAVRIPDFTKVPICPPAISRLGAPPRGPFRDPSLVLFPGQGLQPSPDILPGRDSGRTHHTVVLTLGLGNTHQARTLGPTFVILLDPSHLRHTMRRLVLMLHVGRNHSRGFMPAPAATSPSDSTMVGQRVPVKNAADSPSASSTAAANSGSIGTEPSATAHATASLGSSSATTGLGCFCRFGGARGQGPKVADENWLPSSA
ncbi:hypothetical protein EV368DRAFT_87183 [Lentinula lateritia]|nr:hypothetical protein EV368DRAFT_87183 [Lentinula lateritia]